jgi:hypothetical protein
MEKEYNFFKDVGIPLDPELLKQDLIRWMKMNLNVIRTKPKLNCLQSLLHL